MRVIFGGIGSKGPPPDPNVMFQKIEQLTRLFADQGFDASLPEAFDMAAEVCFAYGDLARGWAFH